MYHPRVTFADPLAHMAACGTGKPTHYFAPSVLRERVQTFRKGFDGEVTFAMKSNPERRILRALLSWGIDGFDVASPAEIALASRLAPGAIRNYHNPIRSRAEIAEALRHGVDSWSLDSEGELGRLIAAGVPREAELAVRIKLPVPGAVYDFGEKFGICEEGAVPLLRKVAEAGYRPAITFHVGTQCTDPGAWHKYVTTAARVAKAAGVTLSRLNVGGGFPASRQGGVLDLAPYFAAIREGVKAFDTAPRLACEPGRGLVGDAFAYAVPVRALRGDDMFLADGIYGGLSELLCVTPPRIRAVSPEGTLRSGSTRDWRLWGPTCDSLDRVRGMIALPGDVEEGDSLLFDSMGAYLTGLVTEFNGYGEHDHVSVAALT